MQEQTPIRNRRKPINKRGTPQKRVKKTRKAPRKQDMGVGLKSMALNNPYQNVPVKSNNQQFMPRTGFDFPGAVL